MIRMAPITRRIIDAAPNLKVIARHGVGVDHIDCGYAAQKGIWVVNAPTANFNAVAEHVMMCMLSCAKKARAVDLRFRQQGAEEAGKILGSEIEGKTLGILGLGRIGKQLAKKAYAGFDMRVIGFDPYVAKETLPGYVQLKDNIDDVFLESDFVSIHLPLNDGTRGIVNEARLGMMKPSAYLINTARGEIVDERALIAAIGQGKLAGGAFDVLAKTPIDRTHPLLSFEQVIVTPHTAAVTFEAMRNMGLCAARGIDEVLSGKKPTWPVNRPELP